eukprot:scaffold6339_cov112-Isochrysis_galbana.AAC.6
MFGIWEPSPVLTVNSGFWVLGYWTCVVGAWTVALGSSGAWSPSQSLEGRCDSRLLSLRGVAAMAIIYHMADSKWPNAQNLKALLAVTEGAPPNGNAAVTVASSVAESVYSTFPVPSAGDTLALSERPSVSTVSYSSS